MKRYIAQKAMANSHSLVLENRPNKLAKGITAGLYSKTQRTKPIDTDKLFIELPDYHVLSVYGTLDSLARYGRHIEVEKTKCPCCGQRRADIKVYSLTLIGKSRLKELRSKRRNDL